MEWFHKRKQTKKQKFDEEMKAKGGIVDPLNPSRRGFMSMAGTVAMGAMGVARGQHPDPAQRRRQGRRRADPGGRHAALHRVGR